jgi:hypothetical protein
MFGFAEEEITDELGPVTRAAPPSFDVELGVIQQAAKLLGPNDIAGLMGLVTDQGAKAAIVARSEDGGFTVVAWFEKPKDSGYSWGAGVIKTWGR